MDHFEELVDPRLGRNKRHTLIDIVVLTVCAVISGAETWEDIEDYGKYKLEWMQRLIALANGVPSHDTIRRLFIRLDPECRSTSVSSAGSRRFAARLKATW